MKILFPTLLSIFLGCTLLFGSYSSETLYHETEETDYHNIKFYVYKYGTDFHDDEAKPYRLKFYSDLGIYTIWKTWPSGAPSSLNVVRGNMKFIRVNIADGKSEGWSRASKGKKIKVQLLDENEEPIVGEPTYFQVTDYDGTQYRLHAKAGEGHSLGFPIFKITPEGEKHLFADSGFEILFDENGHFKQFRDLSDIYIISYPDENTRIMEKYPMYLMQAKKHNGIYVPKTGSKPSQSRRLTHPKADKYRYMVYESYHDGQLHSTTTWTKGENPYVFRFQTKKEGQDILEEDDYYYDDEEGVRNLERKSFTYNGNHQLDRRSFHDRKLGWQPRYERRVRNGEETINAYDYIEDPFTQETLKLHTLEKTADGNWVKHDYDDLGRLTKTWKPLKEVVPPPPEKDPEVAELLDLFPDPSAEAITQQQDYTYLPENPPEDFSQSMTQGELTVYDYAPLTSDDVYDDTDKRPRTSFTRRNGIPFSTTWNVYGKRENGCLFDILEESSDPEASFGSPENRRTLTDYYAPDHPVAPNKISSITHPDGSLKVYYYDAGTWDKGSQRFTPTPKGKILQSESTEGKLIEGNWATGTTTLTLITNPQGKTLFTQTRVLQADGTWEIQ